MGEYCLKNIKIIAFTSIFILLLIVIPAGFAMDNETDMGISDEDTLSSIDEDILGEDYYFDSSIENDNGNGSIYNPYKELTTNRIKSNSIIHLANGHYKLNGGLTVNNVTIIGESATGTVVDNVVFTVSNSLTLRNVTFIGSSIKSNAKLTAEDSIFKDSYSTRYGSVIYSEGGYITLKNSTFSDNFAVCGGAIFIKSGLLDISNSLFINNYAELFGGAIASVTSDVFLNNVSARNNKADADGGVIYSLEDDIFSVINSTFTSNFADKGGALFIDAANCNIVINSSFINNTPKSLYSFYNHNSIIENNVYSSDDELYETMEVDMFIGNNNYTLYKYNSTKITDLPSKYDLRDYGYITSVKNQGNGGNCWAFASLAVLESCILKAFGDYLDLSESNMKNLYGSLSDYGWNYEINKGGTAAMSYNYLISWLGPVLEHDDYYSDNSLFSRVLNSIMHVQNVLFIQRNNYTDNDEVKKALMTYGAVYTPIYANFDRNGKQYYTGSNNANHAVVIVGWDDDLEFNGAPGKGGWIIKNSWGSGWRNNGYGYVSYYDVTCVPIGKIDSVFTFILNDTIKYDKNYQYDIQGKSDFFFNTTSTVWYKNIYNATDNEYLAAISTIFSKNTNYTFSIYVNNDLKITQSGSTKPGYYTFNLNELIPLNEGDTFEIVFNITVDGDAGVPISENVIFRKYYYKSNTSFISYDGENWSDLFNLTWEYPDHTYISQVACIKAFTVLNPIKTNIKLEIDNIRHDFLDIIATVYNEWGYAVDYGNVTFNVPGKNCTVPIHNGVAKLVNISIGEGINNYTVSFSKIGYLNSTNYALFSRNLTMSVISLMNLSKHNVITLVANVTDINGNLIDYGNIIFNIGGKNYTCDISNGTASLKYTFSNFGLNNVTAYYDGYYCYNPCNTSILVNVSLIKTFLSLNISNEYNPINISANIIDEYGKNVTNGYVIFTIEGNTYQIPVLNGQANLTHVFSRIGLNNVTATYHDTEYIYNSSNDTKSVNIPLINTKLELIAENNTNPIKIKVMVKDQFDNPVLSGEVTFTMDGKTQIVSVDNGIAEYTHVFTKTGFNQVHVSYNDALNKYNSSDNDTIVNVSKTRINMSMSIKGNVEITVEFSQPINEYVNLLIDNKPYIQKTKNGKCTFTFNNLNSGQHTVIAYLNNYIYESSEVRDEFHIYYQTNLTVVTNTLYYGDVYTVILTDVTNNLPVKGKEIQFIINNQTLKNITDKNGVCSIKLNLIGKYDITVNFIGDDDYTSSSAFSTIEFISSIISNDAIKTLNSQYEVKLLDINGKPLNNTEININLASKIYKVTSDENGAASLNIALNPGIYTVEIYNPNTGEVKNQTITVNPRITENKDITAYYGNTLNYKVRVFDDDGNIAQRVTVTFIFDNRQYSITSDKNGYAVFKITKYPGTYTISAVYKDFKVSNKITVKTTIITKNINVKKGKTIKFPAQILNKNGKAVKNKKVTFKFKGKTYKVKTNNKGKATLKITKKYKKGKYQIITKYGGLKVKNTIKIK